MKDKKNRIYIELPGYPLTRYSVSVELFQNYYTSLFKNNFTTITSLELIQDFALGFLGNDLHAQFRFLSGFIFFNLSFLFFIFFVIRNTIHFFIYY